MLGLAWLFGVLQEAVEASDKPRGAALQVVWT